MTENELLALVGLTEGSFARYRGCWEDGNQVVVETRDGGIGVVSDFSENPLYDGCQYDEDDETYIYYYFYKPE